MKVKLVGRETCCDRAFEVFTKTSIRARVHGAIKRTNAEIRRERRPNNINGGVEIGERSDRGVAKDNRADTSRNKRKE